jgi:site-specific DNA recombinase
VTSQGVTRDSSWSDNGDSPTRTAAIYLRVSTVRQARSGGEAEGYSIPAQRQACRRKAEELGASVVDEYIDAGASARSADRPALQALLHRLRQQRDIDYVLVHKLDRLARDRADDVAIGLAIHNAGAVLVSASEQIDETPAGTLLHGIMASIAEFYSKNLSNEAKKGLHEKARRGGTPGYAKLGYLNTTVRIEGREVKAIGLDPERAEHITWAFKTYATGEWSITDLVEELARRGMRTRPTATRAAVPLTRSQVHRILSSPYYIGRVVYTGVEYEGKHPALIDRATWERVQEVLAGRRLAGDRSWRHEHYLKGSLFCARCGSRLGYGASRGKGGGRYPYFFCLGRNKKRTECDLPYLPASLMEEKVIDHWRKMRLASELIEATRESIHVEMAEQRTDDRKRLATQKRRLLRIQTRREKLIDAYLAGALSVPDLKRRQDILAAEERDAQRIIELNSINHELVEQRLEIALGLLEHCDRLYIGADDNSRRGLNLAFFAGLYIDRDGVKRAVLNPPFAQLQDRTIGLADDGGDEPEPKPSLPEPPGAQDNPSRRPRRQLVATATRNPEVSLPRGSNVALLAEGEGFEPSTTQRPVTVFEIFSVGLADYFASAVGLDPRRPATRRRGRRASDLARNL